MAIERFFTTLFVIRRSSWSTDGEGNPFSAAAEVGSFMGHLQQASAELTQNLGMSLTKAFSVWCPIGTAVQEGDVIESVDGVFSVHAVQKNGVGTNAHVQLVVQLDEVAEISGS